MLHSTNDRDLVVDTGVRKRWSSWGAIIPGIGLATLLGGVDVMIVFLLLWYMSSGCIFWSNFLVATAFRSTQDRIYSPQQGQPQMVQVVRDWGLVA